MIETGLSDWSCRTLGIYIDRVFLGGVGNVAILMIERYVMIKCTFSDSLDILGNRTTQLSIGVSLLFLDAE